MRKLLLLCFFAWLVAPVSSEAAPISVDCPGTAGTTDREFTLTTDPNAATCLAYGDGPNELNANDADIMLPLGWTVIDKDEASLLLDNWFSVTGMGTNSGTFTIDPAAWDEWDQLAIGFVVGAGQILPKWAVFELPTLETSGLWSNVPPQGANLSHANLYGMGEPDRDVQAVPEPASLFLFGSGLAVVMRRIRAKR